MDMRAWVDTKYRTVDRKVRQVTVLLPEDIKEQMKWVASDLSLQNPADIGHRFIDETLRELKVIGVVLLLPAEEDWFRRMLERHGVIARLEPMTLCYMGRVLTIKLCIVI